MYIGLHVKYRYSSHILMKLEFFRQIFEKYSNIKFHENPYSGSRVVACGRTDGPGEANSRISQFCEMRLSAHVELVPKHAALHIPHAITNCTDLLSSKRRRLCSTKDFNLAVGHPRPAD